MRLRLAYFSAGVVTEEYRGALAHQRVRSAGIGLSSLPEAIRRERASCVFRTVAQGGEVDVTRMRALSRTGALPRPGSVSDLRQQLNRCWRRWPRR
jgi:hypothetical protein